MQMQANLNDPTGAVPMNGPNNGGANRPPINVDNFIRVRDSVYNRLQTIQQLIQSFSEDYLRQTNLLLGLPPMGDHDFDLSVNMDPLAALGSVTNLGLPQLVGAPAAAAGVAAAPVAGAAAGGIEVKKERKKRTHDRNAPKRPLTPFFLYMKTARPIIASDLGDQAIRGAVQEEGQRRWATMDAAEKAGWHQAYQYNLRLYNARVHSYKSGNATARDMTDEEALRYAEKKGIGIGGAGGHAYHHHQTAGGDDADEGGDDDDEEGNVSAAAQHAIDQQLAHAVNHDILAAAAAAASGGEPQQHHAGLPSSSSAATQRKRKGGHAASAEEAVGSTLAAATAGEMSLMGLHAAPHHTQLQQQQQQQQPVHGHPHAPPPSQPAQAALVSPEKKRRRGDDDDEKRMRRKR